jgi:hypothetical protein
MTLSFEESIKETNRLLSSLGQATTDNARCFEQVGQYIQTVDGARGFFVALLTGDAQVADEPPAELIAALEKSPDITSDLLTKNLVMSTMMALTHQRNADPEAEQGSKKVSLRCMRLIEKVKLSQLTSRLNEMSRAIENALKGHEDESKDGAFLKRWKYDGEQMALASQALSKVLAQRCA